MSRDRMQRQRFELKYLLEEPTALAVREFVTPHLSLDEAGVGRPNYAYRVNSLYLDSQGLYTYWDWVNSNRNRFKLRMRYYDTDPEKPVFLEIKRRVSGCILKQRCGVLKKAAPLILLGQFPPDNLIVSRDPKGIVALERFIGLVTRLQAGPKALVIYLREAYVDPENEGVRLTMDREVRIGPRETCDFSLDMDTYAQPFGDKVILELKFNNRFPTWFNAMVQTLNLTRAAAAKYCEGISTLRYPQLGNTASNPIYHPQGSLQKMDRDDMPLDGAPALENPRQELSLKPDQKAPEL